ncbi:hypothetical protein Afil01_54240 [Actinorhabdospora filicis]|uniref:SCP domain-containing protein n=1 Tax=Actinorhabdospora filicis TaxID=1785913 RepID=A0A9W6W5P8_9ACTN|nr:CAP domain-containing protein [Actinorhabdospora filicis]GLZ80617.1 hypothetical protein Afil01_54240 [Actinorhabdospora filicis]
MSGCARTRLIAMALAAGLAASALFAGAEPARAEETVSQRDFTVQVIQRHNTHRADHHAPPLGEDRSLSARARDAAARLAASGELTPDAVRDAAGDFGVNLAWTNGGALDGGAVVEAWYSQAPAYDYDRPGFAPETGAFTQVVWAASGSAGAGYAAKPDGGYLAIVLYAPRGNVEGQFPDNVLKP